MALTGSAALKVLVTGREGQLARSLIERSPAFPRLRVVALGRPRLDLEHLETINAVLDAAAPDIVVNAAAYTAVDQAEDEPDRAWQVNAEGPGALAAALRRRGGRLVHISTDYVFDGSCATPWREDAPTRPLGVYGRTKLAGEKAVKAADPEAVVIRTAWVYSPFGRNFVKTMMRMAEERDQVSVVADQSGSPTAALDLADGILTMLDGWGADEATGMGRTYHLAGTGTATWHELAGHVFEVLTALGRKRPELRPIDTESWPTKAPRPLYSVLDSTRFAADFGYVMPDWRKSVADTVRRIISEG